MIPNNGMDKESMAEALKMLVEAMQGKMAEGYGDEEMPPEEMKEGMEEMSEMPEDPNMESEPMDEMPEGMKEEDGISPEDMQAFMNPKGPSAGKKSMVAISVSKSKPMKTKKRAYGKRKKNSKMDY